MSSGVDVIQTTSHVKGLLVKDIYVPKIFLFVGANVELEALVTTTTKYASPAQEMRLFEPWRYNVWCSCTYALEGQGGRTHASGSGQGLISNHQATYVHERNDSYE